MLAKAYPASSFMACAFAVCKVVATPGLRINRNLIASEKTKIDQRYRVGMLGGNAADGS